MKKIVHFAKADKRIHLDTVKRKCSKCTSEKDDENDGVGGVGQRK